jgi:nucleotide-binding universal stress UspA family protein
MKVLVGLGGSDRSLQALEETIDHAAAAGDEILVGVIDDPDAEADPDALLEHARSALEDRGLDGELRQVTGPAGGELVEIANSENVDRIVLGGGQRSPMGKIKIGQVAEFVLMNADTTVTLVR